MANKLGYKDIVWLTLAKFFTYGQLILCALVGFEDPDFLAEAAAVLGLYYFYNPDALRKSGFQ